MTLNDAGETRAPAPVPAAPEAPPIQPAAAPQVVAAEPQPVAAVPEAVTTKPEVPEGVTAAGGNWWLQVGIFSVRDNAEGLAQKLRAAGIAVDMDNQAIGGKQMYRVRAGPVRDRAEAVALQARLKASGNDSRLLPP
jgi:DedD protein